MIRHQATPELLVQAATPAPMTAGLHATAYSTGHPGYPVVNSGSHGAYGAMSNQPFVLYASMLPVLVLLAVSMVALLLSWNLRGLWIDLRRIADRCWGFIAAPHAQRHGPETQKVTAPVH